MINELGTVTTSFFGVRIRVTRGVFSIISPVVSFSLIRSPNLNGRIYVITSPAIILPITVLEPNEAERDAKGYSSAWLHHKGRNKHHLEYWIDYSTNKSGMTGMKMPLRYVCEMICDRVAASQIYLGEKYTDASPWEYYEHSKDHYMLHPETRALLEKLLKMVRDLGQERTFAYMKLLLGCSDTY